MTRYRRLRATFGIRQLVAETQLNLKQLVQPFFVIEGQRKVQPIASMPGIARYSIDRLLSEIESYIKLGGNAGLFFGVPQMKDKNASGAYLAQGIVPKAVQAVKRAFPDFVVMTDVCLCAYTDHGHCGIIKNNKIDNDLTLPILGQMALAHARAGADIVAPSDMMDFRVKQIRGDLDKEGFENTIILSYAAKYSSSYYGPFREAAHSRPGFGDRKTYQMDYANAREALKEARGDIAEGADLVMVKPALAYLDIVHLLKNNLDVPVVAYNVSGEYSMVKAAAEKKWVDEKAIVLETLTSIKRAGADIIISYHTREILKWLKSGL